jgi:hypothetical protein
MVRQADERRVPADSDSARAELIPPRFGHVRDVFELQLRPAIRGRIERHFEPRDVPAEFPRHGDDARWLAPRDRPARVSLKLVSTAKA